MHELANSEFPSERSHPTMERPGITLALWSVESSTVTGPRFIYDVSTARESPTHAHFTLTSPGDVEQRGRHYFVRLRAAI